MSKKKITKEEVEEVRHLSKLQESAEELPYAVRNLNLPDLEEEEPIPPTFSITRGIGGFITGMEILTVDGKPVAESDRQLLTDEPPCTVNDNLNLRVAELYREKTGVYPSWYLMVEGRVKALAEDALAREEVERSLYGDGIIEDPDCDGGLLG